MAGWDGIHKLTNLGLAIYFDTEKVKVITAYQVTSALEVLPVLMEIDDETVILVVVYRKSGPVGLFIQDLIGIRLEFPTECRTFVIGDFNLNQSLYENILTITSPSAVTFYCTYSWRYIRPCF